MRLLILFFLIAGLQLSCANSGTGQAPPKTVGKVNLEKFPGNWEVLALLPRELEKGCVRNSITFTLKTHRRLDVIDHCLGSEGKWRQFEGVIEPEEKQGTDKFIGKFNGSLLSVLRKERYWIIYLNGDYQVAMIGDPNFERLWLLARGSHPDKGTVDKMLLTARKQGYDVKPLIWHHPKP